MPDLVTRPAAVHTVSMKARLVAAGLGIGAAPPDPPASRKDEPVSARVAAARSRARERRDAQRQALRPLGLAFIAVVVILSFRTTPAPALYGAGLPVTLVLAVYAAVVATAISVRWAHRGLAAQAAASILIGGCAVALAVLQPTGFVLLAPSLGVFFAAVRLPPVPAAVTSAAITAALALAITIWAAPHAAQNALGAALLYALLAMIGQFLRRDRKSTRLNSSHRRLSRMPSSA